jgi:hypothetical protein
VIALDVANNALIVGSQAELGSAQLTAARVIGSAARRQRRRSALR